MTIKKTLCALLIATGVGLSGCCYSDDSIKSDNRKPFPKEKILTISAENYCKYVGKNLSDYNLVGVHSHDFFVDMNEDKFLPPQDIRWRIPSGTEVVVNYYAGDGTALIPKQNGE